LLYRLALFSIGLSRLLFLHDPAAFAIYTLSLHDALPIYPAGGAQGAGGGDVVHPADDRPRRGGAAGVQPRLGLRVPPGRVRQPQDRKSTRLNSSHVKSSYAVFCLKQNNVSPPVRGGGSIC